MSPSNHFATQVSRIGWEVVIEPPGLFGYLAMPKPGFGLVIFAHGSGSGRHSPRNQFVARALQNAGFGTLLLDLLTEKESQKRENVFDIDLLASRLQAATAWIVKHDDLANCPIGYFGASTGAGAALVAAAGSPTPIGAVVSRGGRPDLAGARLKDVKAPALLIVGGDDRDVLALNRQALSLLGGQKKLSVVPGATHLFEEPGALEQVVDLAIHWFEAHLSDKAVP